MTMDRQQEITLLDAFRKSSGVCTDSRKLFPGCMFFALKGENFDGNLFAAKALEGGAACAVVSSGSGILPGTEGYIVVDDTLEALQALARRHRSSFRIPVIALTGTNGKTTTKELLCSVLSARYNVTATEGNLNNHIGVPLTLLRIDANTEIAVIEMGANHPGEIALLASIALPDYGLITNVGKAHLEGFGSFDGVKAAKGELYDYLQRTADTAFCNSDDDIIQSMVSGRPDLKTVRYGVRSAGVEILPSSTEFPFLRLMLPDGTEVSTHLIGDYNASNVMAAICVGRHFGIPEADAASAISRYVPVNMRSQLKRTGQNLLILDTYNANPTSMKASLDNFFRSGFEHKAVILGDMLELGQDSEYEHSAVLEHLEDADVELKIMVGPRFSSVGNGKENRNTFFFKDVEEAGKWLEETPLKGFTVLLKGSNGIRLPQLEKLL